MKVAESIAKTLKAYDAAHFFLVTGADQDLWFSLYEQGIRLVLTRSEKAAVYMADGYSRISYKPGFVYGQFGPGAANIAAGMADPFWASSPVVAITSSVMAEGRYKREYQEIDQQKMFDAVTKWNAIVTSPSRAPEFVRNAIRESISGVPGPAHLDVPFDWMASEAGSPEIYSEDRFKRFPAIRFPPDLSSISRAHHLISQAERPVLIAGAGVLFSEAWAEVSEFAELLSLPVATSLGGKGSMPENSRLSIGVVGKYSRKSANDVVAKSDLAIAVGTGLGALVTNGYTLPGKDCKIIQIDIEPKAFGRGRRIDEPILADAKLALRALIESFVNSNQSISFQQWAAEAGQMTANWRKRFDSAAARDTTPIKPAAIVRILREVLDTKDIVVADTGYMAAWMGALYDVLSSGRTFLRAAGSLGWAFPAAFGAKLAAADKNVVCITGDGGLGYHIAELETAKRLNIPIIAIVLNNKMLGFEYHDQKYLYGRTLPDVYEFSDVDYGRVASDFGWHGERIDNVQSFKEALVRCLRPDLPSLLDVIIDREEVAPVTYYENSVERL